MVFSQMYYYTDKIEQKRDEPERWQEHCWFASCERLYTDWHKLSFDPDFVSKQASHFILMINEIFSLPTFVPLIISRDISGRRPVRL